MVGIIIRLIELLIVAVPLVAVIIGGMKAVSAARGRLLDASGDTGGVAQPSGRTSGNQSAQWRAINRMVKEKAPKGISSQTQGDQVRVTGKKRDDLQAVIQLLKDADLAIPLQFTNFRD